MSQSVLRNVRQQDRRESVDEFSPASRLRTAFREIPLLSANVCCDRLSANLNALRLLPSVFSISSLVLYTITCLIRTKISYIVAQHSLKGQHRLYNVRGKGGHDEAGTEKDREGCRVERVMLLAAILVSARLLRRSAAAASVSGRWRRLDGLKEGDFNLKKAVGGEFFCFK